MTDVVALAKELSSVGFPALVVVILMGSYYGVWEWGKTCREMKADYEARLAKAETLAQRWQDMALSATGVAEKVAETSGKARRG